VTDDLERWKTAFTMFIARLVVDADGIVDFGELKLLAAVFPDSHLRTLGFLDESGGFTQAYKDAYLEAMRELPNRLNLSQKLDLVSVLHRTSMADGELLQSELLVMREAAEVLGIPLPVLSTHLQTLRSLSGSRG
jgi:uncharacterized tellurite resistance protein B-like protein